MTLNQIQKNILNAKKGRTEGFKRHLERGGTIATYLPFILGDGYSEFWKCRKRYRVVKGSRASKKTVTIARNLIYNMMKYPESNVLVVRKVAMTNKDSTYAELKKAVFDLNVSHMWSWTTSPLELTYKPTGQKILFRGMDDPLKIAGTTVSVGHLCWVWIEEAYELQNEDQFDFVDESVRGVLPDHLWYQLTLSLNPWNDKHWIKKRFFDPIYGEREQFKDCPIQLPDIFAITTNYMLNEFIDDSFKRTMLAMKKNNPKRYKVAGEGGWGASDGVVFEKWTIEEFNENLINKLPNATHISGLDFGWNDPVAWMAGIVDRNRMRIYVYDEIYKQKLSNRSLVQLLKGKFQQDTKIVVEHANPKDIENIYDLGLRRVIPATKGNGSVLAGIRDIQDYTIIVHPRCKNFIMELENYTWNEKKADEPNDEFNHLMDSFRYAMEPVNKRYANSAHKMLQFKR